MVFTLRNRGLHDVEVWWRGGIASLHYMELKSQLQTSASFVTRREENPVHTGQQAVPVPDPVLTLRKSDDSISSAGNRAAIALPSSP
jgi:hypothetical protein